MIRGPRSRPILVALRALVSAGQQEIDPLLAIIESPETTYKAKQTALNDLASLTNSLTLRAADLEERRLPTLIPRPDSRGAATEPAKTQTSFEDSQGSEAA